jgi:hypothetical protein
MNGAFRALPVGCDAEVQLDSNDMAAGFHYLETPTNDHHDPAQDIQMVQRREMIKTVRKRRIYGIVRKFEEGRDKELIRLRMIAIRQADEEMKRGAGERHNPCTFLA